MVLRPQDLETRYWLRVPSTGPSHSVRDIAATSLTVNHFPFGAQSDPSYPIYTIFFLDQVNFQLTYLWSHYWPADLVYSPLVDPLITALKLLVWSRRGLATFLLSRLIRLVRLLILTRVTNLRHKLSSLGESGPWFLLVSVFLLHSPFWLQFLTGRSNMDFWLNTVGHCNVYASYVIS